ncbi:probable inorganic polyphosphate/ATP-NAD kinase [Eubacterium sp. CAG:786]|nr:probable inorganic polyphosphate/ATP-NAD kinase [Eubacterium sp. CAG:786]
MNKNTEKRVIISYNRRDRNSVRIAEDICAELTAAGITPLSLKYDDGSMGGLNGAQSTESGEGCLCMITVGGDGSIISHGKLAAVCEIPLLGVNTGRLGFMANLEPSEIKRIPGIILGEFRVSRRMMMSVEVSYANGGMLHQNTLNDVVVSRDSKSKLPEFCVYCGETEVSRLRADGVIFSTPTGSTAYSLSAGGPIIDPAMKCIEYTALCPHSLFSRPMLFSAERTVQLRVNSYQDSRVTISFDGDSGYPFGDGDVLTMRSGGPDLMLIETGEGFFGSVNRKLMQPLR